MNLLRKIIEYVRIDGLLHIETSCLLVVAFTALFSLLLSNAFALCLGCLFSLVFGILKERDDRVTGKGTAEMHDIYCDVAGIIIGLILCCLLWVN